MGNTNVEAEKTVNNHVADPHENLDKANEVIQYRED